MADDVEPCAGEKNKHVSMEDCEVVVKDDKPEETTTPTETDTKMNVTETLEAINNIEEIEVTSSFICQLYASQPCALRVRYYSSSSQGCNPKHYIKLLIRS